MGCIPVAQRKNNPVWTNVENETYAALQRFLIDHSLGMSEFLRTIIISKMLDEGYLQQEQLEEIMLGR